MEGGSFKDTARKAFTSEDIRFATKGNTLYAIVLAWPGNGRVTIRSLAGDDRKIRSVHLLGSTAQVKWRRNSEELTTKTAGQKPAGYASALKID